MIPGTKEISILDIEGVCIGQTEDKDAKTGCTVFLAKEGAPCGLDIRGGGPASRESGLLDPLAHADIIHAVVFSGGSAFGLEAADGVMKYLEEHNVGVDVGLTKVPLVASSCIFDLGIGSSIVRPDKAMGYEACRCSEQNNYRDGSFGVGTGATVGKLKGMDYSTKSGIGSFAVSVDNLQVGAVVVVNSYGNVYDYKNGQIVSGMLADNKKEYVDATEYMYRSCEVVDNKFAGNTTLGIVFTNAEFNKTQLCKIAGMCHDGYARSIRPIHTSVDGDSIYAMSLGRVVADKDMVGTLAADVVSEAILRAVLN